MFSRGSGGGDPSRGLAGGDRRCWLGPEPAAVTGMQPGDSPPACVTPGWASGGQKQDGGCDEGSLRHPPLLMAIGGSRRGGLAGKRRALLSHLRVGRCYRAGSQRRQRPCSIWNRGKRGVVRARELFLSGFRLVCVGSGALAKAVQLLKAGNVSISTGLCLSGVGFFFWCCKEVGCHAPKDGSAESLANVNNAAFFPKVRRILQPRKQMRRASEGPAAARRVLSRRALRRSAAIRFAALVA